MRTIRAFLWGTAIGAMVGLLFAPQRGELTRNQLQDRINSWQGRAQSQFGTLKTKTNQLIEQSRKTTNNVFGPVNKPVDTTASAGPDAIANTGRRAE